MLELQQLEQGYQLLLLLPVAVTVLLMLLICWHHADHDWRLHMAAIASDEGIPRTNRA